MMDTINQQNSVPVSMNSTQVGAAMLFGGTSGTGVGTPTNVGTSSRNVIHKQRKSFARNNIEYWERRWQNHPMNISMKGLKPLTDSVEWKWRDWEKFVVEHDVIYRQYCENSSTLPFKGPPEKLHLRKFKTKHGVEIDVPKLYQTYFDRTEDPNEVFTINIMIYPVENASKRVILYGHMEAALKKTKCVWESRCIYKKAKDNWKYVITPICMNFIFELQKLISGEFEQERIRNLEIGRMMKQRELEDEIRENVKQMYSGILHPPIQEEIYEEEEEMATEFEAQSFSEETATILDASVYIEEPHVVEFDGEDNEGFVEVPFKVRKSTKEKVKLDWPFKFYPRINRLPFKHSNRCKAVTTFGCLPIFTPEEMTRNYFEGLPEIMFRIGREDMLGHCCRPAWEWWTRKRIKFEKQQEEDFRTSLIENARKAGIEREAQSDCDDFVFPWRLKRCFNNLTPILTRHHQKMAILCQQQPGIPRGQRIFDNNLYERQARIIRNLREVSAPLEEWARANVRRGVYPRVPNNYVDEAREVLNFFTKAAKTNKGLHYWCAIKALDYLITRWEGEQSIREYRTDFEEQIDRPEDPNEFDYSLHERDRRFTTETLVRVPQSDTGGDKPPVKSAGPAAGGAKSGGAVTGAEKVDVPITTAEKKVTLSMADQREVKKAGPVQQKKKLTENESSIKDVYNMLKIVERPMYIDRREWKSTDEDGKQLIRWVLPNVYFNSAQGKSPTACQALNASYVMSMFGAAKFNMKIRIVINSVKFQQGRLLCVFVPFYTNERETNVFNNYTQFPSVFVDASVSNSIELAVPWTNPRNAFPLYTDPNHEMTYFGTFHVFVWNRLYTGANSSSDTSISVFMWLEDLEVFQLCNPKDPGKISFATDIIHGVGEHSLSELPVLRQDPITVQPRPLVREAQALDGLLETGVGMATQIGADLVESLLGKLSRGLNSKPNGVNPPMPVVPWVSSNSSQGEGLDLSQRLSLETFCAHKPDPAIGKPPNLKTLLKQWSRIIVGGWRAADTENASIMSFPVTPMTTVAKPTDLWRQYQFVQWRQIFSAENTVICQENHETTMFGHVRLEPSMMQYLGMMYYFWHGSLKFKIEAVCTSMHSGRLLIRYEPFGYKSSADKECQKVATPGIVWDLQENHTIEFEAPYMSIQPYLNTLFSSNGAENDIETGGIGNWACGLIEMTVMNKLKVTTGISDYINFNIYMAAGDDFEFFSPSPLSGIVCTRNWSWGIKDPKKKPGENLFDWLDNYFKNFFSLLRSQINLEMVKVGDKNYVRSQNDVLEKWKDGPWAAKDPKKIWELSNKSVDILNTAGHVLLSKMRIPKFSTQVSAFNWLMAQPKKVPTRLTQMLASYGLEVTDLVWERMCWWYTIPLMRASLDAIKYMPKAYDIATINGKQERAQYFSYLSAGASREAQSSDTAQGKVINPFTTFISKIKSSREISGEDHMDMYKLMKRWSLWKTCDLPVPLDQNQGDTKQMEKRLYNHLGQFNNIGYKWEHRAYCWELRIPVTPMLPYEHVGTKESSFNTGTPNGFFPIAAHDIMKDTWHSGYETSIETSMTRQHYLGQLFTFWRGSLRWRFTFPEPKKDGFDDAWCVVVYDPKQMPSSNRDLRVANMKSLRDNTKLGSVLYSGVVMANIDVETPFYSQYDRLVNSDYIYNGMTTAGSLIVYFPMNIVSKYSCDEYNWDSTYKALRTWIWQAVGDDFEYQIPRSAPHVNLYPLFHADRMSLTWNNGGYDRWDSAGVRREQHRGVKDDQAIIKEIKGVEPMDNTIKSIEIMHPFSLDMSDPNLWYKDKQKAIQTVMNVYPESTIKTLQREAQGLEDGEEKASITLTGSAESVNTVNASLEKLMGRSTDVKTFDVVSADVCDGALDKLADGLLGFCDVVTKVNAVFPDLQKKTSDMLVTLEGNSEKITSAVTETANIVKTGVKYTLNATRIGIFFHGIHSLLQAEDWNDRWIPMAECALALGLSPEVVTKAGEWLLSQITYLTSPEKVHEERKAEAWEDAWDKDITSFLSEHSGTLRMVAAGVITIVTFYITPDLPSTSKVKQFSLDMVNKLRNVAFIGAGLKTLDWMFRWIAEVIKNAIFWVADTFSGGLVTAHRMSSQYPEVLEWLQNVEKYDIETYRQAINWDHEARIELWKQMDRGKELAGKLASRTGPLHNTLTRGMLKLTKLDQESTSVRNVPAFRMDPIHICFYGKPGVKKSSILTYVLGFVANELGYPIHNRFYARSESEEHWNGYDGQLITLIDDLAQNKKGKAIEELISMKSNVCWHVPMASLENKGKAFTSKIIGSTTNILFPAPDNINDKQALWRRRNVLIEVKQTLVQGDDKNSWASIRFDIIDPQPDDGLDTKRVLRENLTMVELMVFLIETTRKWERTQKGLVYAGLQGKALDIPDLGQIAFETSVEISNAFQGFVDNCRRKRKFTEEYLEKMLDSLSMKEWNVLVSSDVVLAHLHTFRVFGSIFSARRLALDALAAIRSLSNLKEDALVIAIQQLTEGTFKGIVTLKESTDGGVKKMLLDVLCRGTIIKTFEFRANEEDRTAQALSDDVLAELDAAYSDQLRDIDQTRDRAQESLRRREELLSSYEDIIDNICLVPNRRKTISLANDDEIQAFVIQYFPGVMADKRNELVKAFSEAFTRASKNKEVGRNLASEFNHSAEIKKLFTKKLIENNWKLKDKDWIFEIELDNDENFELFTLYGLLTEEYTQVEINTMLNTLPKEQEFKVSTYYKSIKTYYDEKIAKIQKWFDEHPKIKWFIKLGGALAGVFLGYKILNYLFPKIIDKIKAAFCALFGWTKTKIGEERVERWTMKGKELAGKVSGKTSEYLAWVKGLMKSSNDADLQMKADDPEYVELYAESLSNMRTQAKTATEIKLRREVIPEGRRTILNAYMLGQDKNRISEAYAKNQITHAEAAALNPITRSPEGCLDPNAKSLRDNVLMKNMVRLHWSSAVKSNTLTGVFLTGRIFIAPFHFWNKCEAGQPFAITNRAEATWYENFDPMQCVKIPGQDLALYQCSVRVGQYTSILKHFFSDQTPLVSRTPATLLSIAPDGSFVLQRVQAEAVKDITYEMEKGGEKISNMFAWDYEAITENGDCGALLIADNNALTRKILGLHVCGAKNANIGTSAFVTSEELEQAILCLPKEYKTKVVTYDPQCLVTSGEENMKIVPQGNFTIYGAVSKSNEVRLPHKTEIRPSIIHDMVREHVTEPSVLTTKDPRLKVEGSPLLRAISKYGVPTYPFPKRDLHLVFKQIECEVLVWPVKEEARLLTDWEAVFGNDMVDYCDRMNLGASPGYPWTLSRPSGEKGKAYLFDVNAEDGIGKEDYRYAYRSREKLARAGMRKVSIWTDCLKDERRTMAKIAAGKTRAFMLPPADYVQLCRKYFMMFSVTFYANKINSFSAVGVDPYSYDWTRIVRKLRRNSNLAFAGDFHSFDGIFDPEFMWYILKIINKWYQVNDKNWNEEDDVVREILTEEMIHTVHICINGIYEKHQGNPSGNPLTVIVNTFAHYAYLLLSWLGIARVKSPDDLSMLSFSRNVVGLIYGDDGIYTVKREASEWFNCKNMSLYLSCFGIEYTDENKSGDLYTVKDMRLCNFLKNGFVKMKNNRLWLAPISIDTIYELTNWIRACDDPVGQLRENLGDVFSFAFHHGEEFFESVLTRVNDALMRKGLQQFVTSYELEKEKFLAKCLN